MIHNLTAGCRRHMELRLSAQTARTYANRLDILLANQSVTDTVGNLDMDKILDKLSEIKYKNHFSQSKNAFLHFCEFQRILLSDEVMGKIESLEKNTHKKYRKQKTVDFGEVDRKIKHIRNMKLKLSYQTIIATGLRVSELAGISPADCIVSDNEITFSVVAKGGNNETVTLLKNENPLLFQRLKEHVQNTKKDKLFYSTIYLQTKATELGFTCHDLRRAYAKLEYKKSKSKEDVQEKLRHASIKNTNIYLKSRVNI